MQEIMMLGALVALIGKSINSQIDNISTGAYNKFMKFIIIIGLSFMTVFIAVSQTIYQFDIVKINNVFDYIVMSVGVGLAATGSFDVLKEIIKSIGKGE